MRTLQIGIMGSASDLNYSQELENRAKEMGLLIAQSGNVLMYGAEKDYDSLSTAAARGAKKYEGMTIGVTYGRSRDIFNPETTDVIIRTGLERGGGREFVLVNSCDVIIAISGGSGTLTEMAMAYQANIPIVCITGFGGWSEKLAGEFIDERKRLKCVAVNTPEEAVETAISLVIN